MEDFGPPTFIMADTLLNIPLPTNTWIDLYAESGIPVGTLIKAQNIGVCSVYLTTSADKPTDDDKYQIMERGIEGTNQPGSEGEWAMCLTVNGLINVRRA